MERSGLQQKSKLISIIMPAHNEGHHIYENILRTRAAFGDHTQAEIIVVNDGSTDQTDAEIRRAAQTCQGVRAVTLEVNKGKGEALRQGFKASRGDLIVFLDGDLDLPPEQIISMFSTMETEHADVVVGSKRHPRSSLRYPLHRRIYSEVYFHLAHLLIGLHVRDTQTGLKLFRRDVLEYVMPRMLVRRFAFDVELLTIASQKGFSIAESPVTLHYRATWGRIGTRAIWQILIDTLAIFYRSRILHYYENLMISPMPNPVPTVSVVIAFAHDNPFVTECLEGLARQTHKPLEVILLPDAPLTRTVPGFVRVISTGPIRPALKRNLGIRESKGDIVAFLDDDTTPQDNWLEEALANFSAPDVAAVGGPGITPDNDPPLAQIGGCVYSSWLGSGGYRYRYVIDRFRYVDDYPSCNLLVRKKILEQVGGFSADYWPGEDTVLCLDITHKLGLKIIYDPRVIVEHHRRPIFIPHLRQLGRYAVHRGYFAKRFPQTSARIGYFIPALFALGLVSGLPAALACHYIAIPYFACVSLYLTTVILLSFSINPLRWFLTTLAFVATHLTYGFGIWLGLLRKELKEEQSEV